ncbi:hypothetical protein BGZ50_000526, partial [Haplosporangium sp. Z 11]
AYCSLKGEAGSVDKDAIAERTDEIRNICSELDPDDIYNCDETGMYLKELSTRSYTTKELTSGAHLVRNIQHCPEVPITSERYGNGYMTMDLFKTWLTLWMTAFPTAVFYLSTHVEHTAPLDAANLATTIHLQERHGSIFYLEMLSNKAIAKECATGEKITNGEVWPLIQYAWSQVRAMMMRHYFCKAGILSKAQVDKLEQESMNVEERPPLYPSMADTDVNQAKRRYVRLIASVMNGDKIRFSLDRNQKDAQEMAEKIKQKVRSKIVQRYGPRGRSSSIEPDAVEPFKSMYEGVGLATMVVEMLEGEDASHRRTARYMI